MHRRRRRIPLLYACTFITVRALFHRLEEESHVKSQRNFARINATSQVYFKPKTVTISNQYLFGLRFNLSFKSKYQGYAEKTQQIYSESGKHCKNNLACSKLFSEMSLLLKEYDDTELLKF